MCSFAFAGTVPGAPCPSPSDTSALALYQSSNLVVLNGSTTNILPAVGPAVFNATTISDPGWDAWYAQERRPCRAIACGSRLYQFEFGVAPTDFADLYFDATRLLLSRLDQTATVVNGRLVIDRAALASAVRHTTRFPGITCTIALDPATGFRVNDQAALARCAKQSLFRGHRR